MMKFETLFPDESQIPEHLAIKDPLETTEYLVNGRITRWTGEMQRVESPVVVKVGGHWVPQYIGSCPFLDHEVGAAAVEAVRSAYDNGIGAWPTMGVRKRIEHVEAFSRRMLDVRDDVVRLMMWEIGKPYGECCTEFDRTVEYIRETIGALRELERDSSRFVCEGGIYAQIRRAPLGPTLCMGPYNYPFNELFATLLPALLMGNPVIIATPHLGKLLFAPLMEAFRDCFPPGVVNLVFGNPRVIAPILESGAINVLAFIGSSETANAMRRLHPHPHRLRCVFGLGAKNAAIVMKSADIELAVSESVAGSLAFSGQRCTALKILFVHESKVDEFIELFNEKAAAFRVGMPWDDGVRITPLPEPGKVEYLSALVDDAKAHGARIVNSGGGQAAKTLFSPTVLYPVTDGMRIYHEEQFGPVVPIVPFTDVETPIRYVIESRYGQQVSIFSDNPEDVAGMIDPLVNQVCRVNINSLCQRGPDSFPFTGRKDSAEGTLSVEDALRCFSISTLVAAKGTEANKALLTGVVQKRQSNFLSSDFLV